MNVTRTDKLLDDPGAPAPEDFYRYVLRHAAVHVTIMGLRDAGRFQRVAAALSERATLTEDERARLETYATRMRADGRL